MNLQESTIRLLTLGALSCAAAQPAAAESRFDRELGLLRDMLALGPEAVVADIGAGDGDYALALAPGVRTVFATEIEAEKREKLNEAAREQGVENLRVVAAKPDATGLADASCDAAFLRDVYHHVTDPEPFLASLFRTIRPGGRLVMIDFPPTLWLALWTPKGIPENRGGHGITRELLIAEAKAAGFVPIRTVEKWPSSNFVTRTYGVAFERP